MKRREFIVGLGAAAAWPVASQAQQPPIPVIGLLHGISEAQGADRIAALRTSLAGTGFVDGRSIVCAE